METKYTTKTNLMLPLHNVTTNNRHVTFLMFSLSSQRDESGFIFDVSEKVYVRLTGPTAFIRIQRIRTFKHELFSMY